MRKLSFLLVLALSIASVCWSQIDPAAAEADYNKLAKDPKTPPYGNNKAAGKYYNIRGFRMYCEIYGSGEPVLIIHGNGGNIANFFFQIPYFAQKYRVIVADSRSHDKSFDMGDSLTYEMMADDYAALLDSVKVDSANVIGWSDGGINALLLAIRHPNKVKKLAITGANLEPDTNAVFQEVWDLVRPDYDSLKRIAKPNLMQKASLKLMRLLMEQPHIPVSALAKIKVPALVIGGDHDVIKESHTMLIYQSLPKAYLWILPASGHSTPINYHEDFNRIVDRFFSNPYREIKGGGRFQ